MNAAEILRKPRRAKMALNRPEKGTFFQNSGFTRTVAQIRAHDREIEREKCQA